MAESVENDHDEDMEVDSEDDDARCLTGFSSVAAVGGLMLTEESRNFVNLAVGIGW